MGEEVTPLDKSCSQGNPSYFKTWYPVLPSNNQGVQETRTGRRGLWRAFPTKV